jgi:beta-lactamase regulating signal transducer with metallopeptidase domain
MMNYVPQLIAGNETMLFVASVLVQATLVIVLALVSVRLLRHQPLLRHSVLVGGLLCVCFCPAASYLADRVEVPLISITWPSSPTSYPHRTVTSSTSREADGDSSPAEVPTTLASLPSEVRSRPPMMSSDVIEPDTAPRQAAPERVTIESESVIPDESPTLSSVSEITHGPVWIDVANIAGLIWLVGIAVIAIRLLLAWQFLNRLRSSASSLDEQSLPQLREVTEEVLRAVSATRLPPLLVSEQLKGPISLGLFRPAIVFPREMIQALSTSQLRDVLIHEMAHIHRHDHVVVLLQRLAGAIFWPFPLVWRLNAKIDEAREDVCDNYVLRNTEASQYSRMLLELTERAAPPQAIPLAIGLWKSRRKLEQRVTALLDPRRTTRTRLPRRTLFTLAAAFALIAVLLAGSRILPTSNAQAADSQQLAGEKVKATAKEETKDQETKKNAAKEAQPDVAAARDKADPYDTLYDVIMTRWKNGKAYAQDETSPAVFSWSEFPFDNHTFDKFNAALDAFAGLPQEKIERYSDVQRALMQRNLWELFETTFNWKWSTDWWWDGQRSFPKTHIERRAIAQPKLASLIKRLALTKEQILALPNTMAATIKSGQFAEAHDPADPFKPFLPRDIHSAAESSWICLGEDGEKIPADLHTWNRNGRSMFLQFMRLPGGRATTLAYMERISKRPHQFPVGTQFALVEQPLLISKDGDLIVSPLVVAVQLRAYLDIGRDFRRYDDEPKATQCVAEFVIQPRQLMKGNAVMRAMGPKDFHFDAGAETATPGFSPRDPFMTGKIAGSMPLTRLNQCMDCHSRAGGRGVRTRSFKGTYDFFTETNPVDVGKATVAEKRGIDNWKTLQKYWRGEPVELPKPIAETKTKTKPKPELKPDRFPDTPELRAALFKRVENEVATELKTLHAAVLLAEVAKLTDMFNLDETESGKLRQAAQEAANSAVEKARGSIRRSFTNNANNTLNKKLLVDGRRNDPDLTAFRFNDRFIILDANDQDPTDRNKYDSLGFELERKGLNHWLRVGFKFGTSGNTAGPKDSDVQNEELWKKALSAVLAEEQVTQYTEHKANRLKTTVVDMMVMALQFDLDLEDSQLPAVRRRIEERVKIRASYRDIESTVGPELQRLKAEALGDILSEEQLNAFPEHPKSRIKSTIISLVLTALKFDLHLADSHLPVVRKRLEERINPTGLSSSVESKAMRIRWSLKEKDFTDVLTEPELTLWRFTQEQHN